MGTDIKQIFQEIRNHFGVREVSIELKEYKFLTRTLSYSEETEIHRKLVELEVTGIAYEMMYRALVLTKATLKIQDTEVTEEDHDKVLDLYTNFDLEILKLFYKIWKAKSFSNLGKIVNDEGIEKFLSPVEMEYLTLVQQLEKLQKVSEEKS